MIMLVVTLWIPTQYGAYLCLRRRNAGGGVGVVVGSGDGVGKGAVAAQGTVDVDDGDGVGRGAVAAHGVDGVGGEDREDCGSCVVQRAFGGDVGASGVGDGVGAAAVAAHSVPRDVGASGVGDGVGAAAAAAHSVPRLLLMLSGERLVSLSLSLSKSAFFQPWFLSQCCRAQA